MNARAHLLWVAVIVASSRAVAQRPTFNGPPASLFGTTIERGQLVIFPFLAFTRDHNLEYQPAEFGFALQDDVRGRFRSEQAQLFIAYGITDWLAVEVESSRIHARLDKAANDTSAMPGRIDESGFGDFEAQLRLRRGNFFGSIELLPPQQRSKRLFGDAQWNVKGGIGFIRPLAWGTFLLRTTLEYNRGDGHWDLGETALEFLRDLGAAGRLSLAIEGGEGGAPDDYGFVSGIRWRIGRGVFVKFDNALGLMSKATDWESQLGVMVVLH
jgi:hypothetical protein